MNNKVDMSKVTLELSMGLRGTYWQVIDHEDPLDGRNNNESFHREMTDYQLDLSTQVNNIMWYI